MNTHYFTLFKETEDGDRIPIEDYRTMEFKAQEIARKQIELKLAFKFKEGLKCGDMFVLRNEDTNKEWRYVGTWIKF